jgi:peroxiredoxin
MKHSIIVLLTSLLVSNLSAQGYKVGDLASDFKLENVDHKFYSFKDFPNAKGFIVIFTCNHCPYAQAYQDRIIEIDNKYKPLGYPVIAINPNDPDLEPEDSFDNMVKRSKEKGYTFPYLFDNGQNVYRQYGASKTPHVYLLQRSGDNLIVKYIGAIDDNYKDASMVKQSYLKDAVDAVLLGKQPNPSITKAIGCSIKDKRNKI